MKCDTHERKLGIFQCPCCGYGYDGCDCRLIINYSGFQTAIDNLIQNIRAPESVED